jgi:hypothetical protein
MAFDTSATTLSGSGTTGTYCSKTGPYRSSSGVTIFIKSGTKFPVDPTTSRSTTWRMGATTFATM